MSTIMYRGEKHVGIHRVEPLDAHRAAPGVIDMAAAEQAVRDLLIALGRDPSSPHLQQTPRRVAHAFAEQLTPEAVVATTFPNDEGYDELVIVRDIPFHSLCEHHLLPFTGVAHVGYLPGERIVGLSKLARAVEHFSRDLQVQERLTQQVSGWLQRELNPRGSGVVIEAEHTCMSLRGIRAHDTKTVTSAFTGDLLDDEAQQRFWKRAGM